MLPLVSDVEVGEFVSVHDSPTEPDVHLACVMDVDYLTISLSA